MPIITTSCAPAICAHESYDDECKLTEAIVDALTRRQVIGFHQGRFEWGPRALGNRSILADPRGEDMKEIVNTKIKFREPFPAIRAGDFARAIAGNTSIIRAWLITIPRVIC